jgi:hypothetical protein
MLRKQREEKENEVCPESIECFVCRGCCPGDCRRAGCRSRNPQGQVLGAGAPIANSTVTLWAASAGAPRQLAQVRTGNDGLFELSTAGAPDQDGILYLVAK